MLIRFVKTGAGETQELEIPDEYVTAARSWKPESPEKADPVVWQKRAWRYSKPYSLVIEHCVYEKVTSIQVTAYLDDGAWFGVVQP